jgi:hypothetical protein
MLQFVAILWPKTEVLSGTVGMYFRGVNLVMEVFRPRSLAAIKHDALVGLLYFLLTANLIGFLNGLM